MKVENNNKIANNTLINPYELLGINIKDKNLKMKDVKKAYFDMAMICHPDKGGNNNDMNIVQKAYQFVQEQMKHHSNMTDENIESIDNDFYAFYKKQEEIIPPFADIYHDVGQWQQKFNEEYESERARKLEENDTYGFCSPVDGYGNQMETSSYMKRLDNDKCNMMSAYDKLKEEYNSKLHIEKPPCGFSIEVDKNFFKRGNKETNYKSDVEGPICLFGKQIIKSDNINGPERYQSSVIGYTNTRELIMANKSIYCNQNGFSMTDYKEAHQEPCLLDLTQIKEKTTPIEKLMELRMNNRDEMDTINNKMLESEDNIDLSMTAIVNRREKMNQKMNKEIVDNFIKNNKNKGNMQARSYVLPNLPVDLDIKIEDRNLDEERQETIMRELANLDIVNDFVIIDENDIIKGIKQKK